MTYKTLRRKSDGQWMRLFNGQIIKSDTPDMWEEKYCKALSELPFNWSLYELVEVAVIPVDDMPSDITVQKHIESMRHESGQPMMDEQTFYEGAMWYKSQILKP